MTLAGLAASDRAALAVGMPTMTALIVVTSVETWAYRVRRYY
jgi:hypothetical protein